MTSAVEDRLNRRHVKEPSGCWRWTGATASTGYGVFGLPGTTTRAHRMAYLTWVGPIPDGLVLDHTCHNATLCTAGDHCPHRACINPAHLEPVTQRVNTLRSGNHVADQVRRTHCPSGHAYDEANTYVAPSRPNARYCRACRSERNSAVAA